MRHVLTPSCVLLLALAAPACGPGQGSPTPPPGETPTPAAGTSPTGTHGAATPTRPGATPTDPPEATAPPGTPWTGAHLWVGPSPLVFGEVPQGCASTRALTLQNTGEAPLELLGTSPSPSSSAAFTAPMRQGVLDPGASILLDVTYVPQALATENGSLIIETAIPSQAVVLVPLEGRGGVREQVRETFVQPAAGAIDLLMILDFSGSMVDDYATLGPVLQAWVTGLLSAGTDFQLGFTSVDPAADRGRLLGSYGAEELPYITDEMGALGAEELGMAITREAAHTGTGDESGLDSMALALSPQLLAGENAGFIRAEASLGVFVLSDEDDHGRLRVTDYAEDLDALKGGAENVAFSGVVSKAVCTSDCTCEAPEVGQRYLDIIAIYGGVSAHICDQEAWSGALDLLAAGSRPPSSFVLPQVPEPGFPVDVWVDGLRPPTGSWSFDPGANAVVFLQDFVPAPGSVVEVGYVPTGSCPAP